MNPSPSGQLHLVVLPALGVPPHVYAPLLVALNQLPATKATLLSLPSLGQGWRALWTSNQLGYRQWLDTIEARVAQLRSDGSPDHVVLLGHSIGGQVGLLALARKAVQIDGLVLVASGTPCWKAWPPAEQPRLRNGLRLIAAALALWPWYPGDWLGFGGRQPKQLMRDWLSTARTGHYEGVLGLTGTGACLARAQGKVLAIHVEGDFLAPPEATRAMLSLAPALQVERAVADSDRLRAQSPMRRHNLWPRDPDAVLPHVLRWLRRHATNLAFTPTDA
jgi:predicted alpha/beta hydrolase